MLLYLGVANLRYEEFTSPSQMSTSDFDRLLAKNNWTTEVKKSLSSILFGRKDPPVLLTYYVVRAVFHVKPHDQYGQSTKHLDTAYQVINYGLFANRVVVPHCKVGGQHIHPLTHEMLLNWVEALCDNYSGNKIEQYFQGDCAAPNEFADMLVNSGIPAHALMDGNDWSAEQLFCYLLI